jgi:hypothetical protein
VPTRLPALSGRTVVCIATGPSLTQAQIDFVYDYASIGLVSVIAVCDAGLDERAPMSAPWADILYAGDWTWWSHWRPTTGAVRACGQIEAVQRGYADVCLVVEPEPVVLDRVGVVWSGRHSGIQALQLAVTLDAAKVCLLGYDCRMHGNRRNFYRDRPRQFSGPWTGESHEWASNYARLEIPVPVINCTPGSAIDCFPRSPIEEAL